MHREIAEQHQCRRAIAAARERRRNSSTMATDSMNPAPNATSSSITRSSRTARRVTASAPSTLPAAATRAYNNALDT